MALSIGTTTRIRALLFTAAIAGVMMLFMLFGLGGCKTQADWQASCNFLTNLDGSAADLQQLLPPDKAADIAHFREIAEPVLESVCTIAQDPNADDPTTAIALLLNQVEAWALAQADEELRWKVQVGVLGARAALRAFGVTLPAPPTPTLVEPVQASLPAKLAPNSAAFVIEPPLSSPGVDDGLIEKAVAAALEQQNPDGFVTVTHDGEEVAIAYWIVHRRVLDQVAMNAATLAYPRGVTDGMAAGGVKPGPISPGKVN